MGMSLASSLQKQKPDNLPSLTLGGGCFWCVESEFRRLEGVVYTECGYEGGNRDNPSYEEVCTGTTGHAEVTKIWYDPAIVHEEALLEHFLTIAHDPTQKDAQGVDIGTQYRSVIFYDDTAHRQRIQNIVDRVNTSGRWPDPVATSLEPQAPYWPAEPYHQQYYEKYEARTGAPHIRAVYKEQKRKISNNL